MNYTNANDPDHEDNPTDWLNGALIFARALGVILRENEGIVVDLKGDMLTTLPERLEGATKVIVFSHGGQILIDECEEDVEEGTMAMIFNENPN